MRIKICRYLFMVLSSFVFQITNLGAQELGMDIQYDSTGAVIDNENCLQVNLNVLSGSKKLKTASIKLYHNNTLIKTYQCITGSQIIMLERERFYTIIVSDTSHYTRLVSISTTLPKKISMPFDYVYKYDLDLALVKKVKEKIDMYYLDFPIAIVSYDEEKGCFFYHKKYTDFIKNTIEREVGHKFAGN